MPHPRSALPPVLLGILGLLASAQAAPREIQLRAYLHDPLQQAAADLKITGAGGTKVPVEWRLEGWSAPLTVNIDGPDLLFQTKDGTLAARAGMPDGHGQRLVLLARDPAADAKPPYRAIVFDASPSAFPWGSSQVVSMIGGTETAIQAGEHRLRIAPGRITKVPPVTQRDEFNMAQVNFYLSDNGQWQPITERRLQFVADTRRIFLIHATPGSRQPFVTTLIDHQVQRQPGS